jgi:hypothetical protein
MSHKRCEHEKQLRLCRECPDGGSAFCIHDRQKSNCKECGGSSICIHDRRKSTCKDCGGSSICIHDRMKNTCKDCGGSSICIHDRMKNTCKECGGSSICIHDRQKSTCKECSPDSNAFCKSCRLFIVSKKNNHLCSYCNPDSSSRQRTKENQIQELLIKENISFVNNKTFTNDCCLKYRPDFLIDCDTHFLVVEVDENAHSGYEKDCEIIRMNNISHGLGLPTRFIRYNPDSTESSKDEREDALIKCIKINLETLHSIEPIYLFYP